jgi:hypothetical protein
MNGFFDCFVPRIINGRRRGFLGRDTFIAKLTNGERPRAPGDGRRCTRYGDQHMMLGTQTLSTRP